MRAFRPKFADTSLCLHLLLQALPAPERNIYLTKWLHVQQLVGAKTPLLLL